MRQAAIYILVAALALATFPLLAQHDSPHSSISTLDRP